MKSVNTHGDVITGLLECTTPDEVKKFLICEASKMAKDPRDIIANVRWMAGYYSNEDREKIMEMIKPFEENFDEFIDQIKAAQTVGW